MLRNTISGMETLWTERMGTMSDRKPTLLDVLDAVSELRSEVGEL